MVMKIPIFPISNFSFDLMPVRTLNSFKIRKRITAEKNTLYQTRSPSLSEMSLPNMPVKPASTTAKCNAKYDFFIK